MATFIITLIRVWLSPSADVLFSADVCLKMVKGKNKNRSRSVSSSSECSSSCFKESDRELLKDINISVKELREEISFLKCELEKTKEVAQVKSENAQLKKAINLNIYSHDELEQYSRRENIRIYGVPETFTKHDDGENLLFQIADELEIELDEYDIQRRHRLGGKPNRKTTSAKPRPIIAKFVSYKKRNEFIFAKAELKKSSKFLKAFITEDLTQLRQGRNLKKIEEGPNFATCKSDVINL